GPFSDNWKPSLGYLEQVLIGILLGDGHLEKSSKGLGTQSRLRITFSEKYKELSTHIADIFSDYMSPNGIRYSEEKSGVSSKLYGRISLTSKVSPLFHYYHNLFYVKFSDSGGCGALRTPNHLNCNSHKNIENQKNKYIKEIPLNIEELLTLLAFFICGDGNYHKTKQIIRFFTNSYTKPEVELLSKVLLTKFNIESRLEHVLIINIL
uniref:LAGLIDADG endonuclease n=1 Tax=Ramaria rubella TaxID=113071 RepID=UPI00223848A7